MMTDRELMELAAKAHGRRREVMDIVERLNAVAQGIDLGAEGMGWSPDTDLIRKAATEIERLSAEREALAKEMETAIKLFAINSTKPYQRGSIIRPHKELRRVLQQRKGLQ